MSLDHLTRDYSHRLGVLTGTQLQAALNRFELGTLTDASPVSGGLFGQNLFVSASSGEYVLRGKPHYDWQFPAEQFFARLIHEQTDVPAPWPYRVETSRDIFGWPFVIMPRMPGRTLPDFAAEDSLSEADGTAIASSMGATLACLHSVTWQHCGEYDLELATIKPIDTSFAHWLEGKVTARIQRCQQESCLDKDDAVWCRELLAANADALEAPFRPSLVHHDYKRGNITVEQRDGAWRVAGVFDLMESYFGDPEEDFVRSVFDIGPRQVERSRAFMSAYRAIRTLRLGYRERFVINMLCDALLIWGFGHARGNDVAPGKTFRDWAEPYVTLDVFGPP